MSQSAQSPLRVLFCIGITQNFFDLPTGKGIEEWKGFSAMMTSLAKLPGVTILGTIDDDRLMVGTPETIKDKVQAIIDECRGLTEISLLCTYAGMEHWRTIRTQQLFSNRLINDSRPAKSKRLVRPLAVT